MLLALLRMDLDDWRRQIDAIDAELVRLLNRRAACAAEIGRLKRERDLDVYSPEREAEVLRHVQAVNGGPLQPEAIARLFERIIDEARRVERLAHQDETSPGRKDAAVADAVSTDRQSGE